MQELINNFLFILERFDWTSVIDIALVTIFFAFLLYMLRDTEALTLLRGVFLVVILITLMTSLVNLPAFSWLVNTIAPAMIFVIPVIFAPEIRRALERVGRISNIDFLTRRSGPKTRERTENTLQEITKAAVRLSERRHGALIVIRRNDFLNQYYKNGVYLNADISAELLLQIFYPNTPLHDGAVIIQGGHILAAGCFLPLSEQQDIRKSFGTRHRAALGLSEETDAVVLIVSEETGAISLAYDSRLYYDLASAEITRRLEELLDLGSEGTQAEDTGNDGKERN